jgi:hypothetical protein
MTPGENERQTMTARYLTPAETTKMIRLELKAAFPATKFSVRLTGGGSPRIEWTDGPTKARVEEIVTKFDGKGFDGMIDLQYHIDGWMLDGKIIGTRCAGTMGSMGTVAPWGMIAPHDDAELVHLGAGYVSTVRNISAELARKCVAQIVAFWGGVDYIPTIIEGPHGHYALENDADYNRSVRPDLTHYRNDWSESIRRAAEDATEFAREASV